MLVLAAILAVPPSVAAGAPFQAAQPVWLSGQATEQNVMAGFRTVIEAPPRGKAVLRVTASNLYRASVNGEFLGHGPARGPHGFFRVDEWDLGGRLKTGRNVVAIEVASYNVASYYLLKQPPFLQAEVVAEGKVVDSTAAGRDGFVGRRIRERLQKTERFSFQRTFTEAYRLRPDSDDWRKDPAAAFEAERLSEAAGGVLLPRRVPYPAFARRRPVKLIASGGIRQVEPGPGHWRSRARTDGFAERELEIDSTRVVLEAQPIPSAPVDRPLSGAVRLTMPARSYAVVDLGTNLTGFVGLRVRAAQAARVVLTFDEILSKGEVRFNRLGTVGAVVLDLAPGNYDFETIEPYTMRYLQLTTPRGAVRVEDVALREYVNPNVWRASFSASDERLNRLFAAGRETFRQNAVDIFMDCPQRERAGWLCDSYFTARVAPDLGGDTVVEKNFLENFLLPKRYPELAEGVLPMCYPADHVNGRFIPNWTLWFVLELEEYLGRSGDRRMVEAFRPKMMRLFEYFQQFRNKDGLLEKLPSWVFIEWSDANRFVQDVNYPSNMLYAAAMAAAGRLYAKPEMVSEAGRIQETIRRQSFDGEFFVDNAVRNGARLEVTRNRTEVCQYFAFYFGTASPESHPKLWKILRDEFGPKRVSAGRWPEIHAANSFVGNMLRAELLSRNGLTQQLLDESAAYLLYMAERTGTLWENVDADASCNHGFASHIVHTLYRDILGIRSIDGASKTVNIRFTDLKLEQCQGAIPVAGGVVALRWRRGPEGIRYRTETPPGYEVKVENLSGSLLTADRSKASR